MTVQGARRLRHAVHQCPRGRREGDAGKGTPGRGRREGDAGPVAASNAYCTAVSSCRSCSSRGGPPADTISGQAARQAARRTLAYLPSCMRLAVSVTGARHGRQGACVSRRVGCASPAGLPPDVRGAPYPVPPVAPVAQARRDRNGRANRGLSSTQRVPSSCSLVPRRRRAIATPAPQCLPACPDARGGRMDCRAESQ